MSPEQRNRLVHLVASLVQPAARDRRTPLCYRGSALGSVAPEFARYLVTVAAWIDEAEGGLAIDAALAGTALEEAWQALARRCRADGWAPAWREEDYDLHARDGSRLCRLERGVFRPFGLRARAVHLNGYTPDGRLWIARRSPDKAVDPGRLDNLVGGGIAAGEAADESVVRECWEEAGIPTELAARVRHAGSLDTLRPEFDGLHDERIEIYDLELPADFVPRNQDGEVAGFRLARTEELLAPLLGGEFTADAGGVTAHWLLRRAD